MIWIAVDAMGGDFAPQHVVDGALAAARHFDLGVILVGPLAVVDIHDAHAASAELAARIREAPEHRLMRVGDIE